MEISANSSQSIINTQRTAERTRDDSKAELQSSPQTAPAPVEDKATTAEPVKESSASEQVSTRNNQEIERNVESQQNTSVDETIGGQIDIRA